MAALDRYICDNPGCGAVIYMASRYRVREPHCVRCRSSLTQQGTAQLADRPESSEIVPPCPVCAQPGMAGEHTLTCPYAGQRSQYGMPLATYLTDQVEVEAWDEKSSRWVPLIRSFQGLTGPEALAELCERHIPRMRLQVALIWEAQPQHRFESLPDSEADSYSWRSMESYPYPVLQVIHGPIKNTDERHSWPAHYFRFKPLQ